LSSFEIRDGQTRLEGSAKLVGERTIADGGKVTKVFDSDAWPGVEGGKSNIEGEMVTRRREIDYVWVFDGILSAIINEGGRQRLEPPRVLVELSHRATNGTSNLVEREG
jgi:hypothetical protein